MTSNIAMATAEMLRDENELEGTLLPVASRVPTEAHGTTGNVPGAAGNGGAHSAGPSSHFVYDDNVMEADVREQQAVSVPDWNENGGEASDSRNRVMDGQRRGRIATEQERVDVVNANRKVGARDYYTKQAIKQANQHARERIRRGETDLYLSPDNSDITAATSDTASTAKSFATNNDKAKGGGYQVGGYEVKEYKFGTDYSTSDYNISEYKSVYD